MMCDRSQYNFAKSQVGFLSFVTNPYFSALASVVPRMAEQVEEISKNVEQYKPLIDEYEEVLKEGNKKF